MGDFNTPLSSMDRSSRWKINKETRALNDTLDQMDLIDIYKAAAAAAAKSLQSCPTLCDPIDQAPLSMGFSRQEHWSGLPFPSPMHESEKWKWSHSVVSDSQWPHGLQPTRLLCPWDFPGKSTGVGCHCLLQFIKHSTPNSRLHNCTWNILQNWPYAGEQDGLDKFKKIETISTNFSDHNAMRLEINYEKKL